VVFALPEVALAEMVEEGRGRRRRCIYRVGKLSPEVAARSWSTVRLTGFRDRGPLQSFWT
jgi:hypothetical protein